MNGPIAQVVALTCYGNAFLQGTDVGDFFSKNSTCIFCDSVKFVSVEKSFFGKAKEKEVAKTPEEWFWFLKTSGAVGIRLSRAPHKDLAPVGHLSDQALTILDASQTAWVFGAMGSWNDMGFDGEDQTEYERVSEQLFQTLNQAISEATNQSY